MNFDARLRYYGIGILKAEDRQRISPSKFIRRVFLAFSASPRLPLPASPHLPLPAPALFPLTLRLQSVY